MKELRLPTVRHLARNHTTKNSVGIWRSRKKSQVHELKEQHRIRQISWWIQKGKARSLKGLAHWPPMQGSSRKPRDGRRDLEHLLAGQRSRYIRDTLMENPSQRMEVTSTVNHYSEICEVKVGASCTSPSAGP